MDSRTAITIEAIEHLMAKLRQLDAERALLDRSIKSERARFNEMELNSKLLRDQIRDLGIQLSLAIEEKLQRAPIHPGTAAASRAAKQYASPLMPSLQSESGPANDPS